MENEGHINTNKYNDLIKRRTRIEEHAKNKQEMVSQKKINTFTILSKPTVITAHCDSI